MDNKPHITPDDVEVIQHIAVWPIKQKDGSELEVPEVDDFLEEKPREYIKREQS